MKIALAPDLHCYYNTYDALTEKGKSSRKLEWLSLGKKMLSICMQKKVDTVIFPGDYFVNPKPSAEEVLMVASLLHKFSSSGMKVLGITGNHDIVANKRSMNEVVATMGESDWCHSSFDVMEVDDVGFAFLPFVKNPEIAAYNPDYANREISDQLVSISEKLFDQLTTSKKILVGHWSIQNASMSSGMKVSTNEVVLPLQSLAKWDACLFGHIHVPQVLSTKPFIAYSGAFQRINVGEANDKRGFYIYDTNSGGYEFHKLPAIPMNVFSKNISKEEDFTSLLTEIEESNIKNHIVYVKYTVDKDNFSLVDKHKILESIEKGNPLSIAGIMPKIIMGSRQRDSSVTENLDAESALEKWLNNRNVDKDKVERVKDLYKQYVEDT